MIEKYIIDGLVEACYTSLYMKKGDFTEIKPEHLITVLISKHLASKTEDYLIKIEESTKEFSRSCVNEHKAKAWYVFSSEKNVSRNGKIDIAVYSANKEDGYISRKKSLFPIEIKAVNPLKNDFLKDVKRNLEYFSLKDNNTGNSHLIKAYNVSIERADNFLYKENTNEFKETIFKKYKNWISLYRKQILDNKLEVKIFINELISQIYTKQEIEENCNDIDSYDFFEEWYYYVGVIVLIQKSESTKYLDMDIEDKIRLEIIPKQNNT